MFSIIFLALGACLIYSTFARIHFRHCLVAEITAFKLFAPILWASVAVIVLTSDKSGWAAWTDYHVNVLYVLLLCMLLWFDAYMQKEWRDFLVWSEGRHSLELEMEYEEAINNILDQE